jgi:hypothetical protein
MKPLPEGGNPSSQVVVSILTTPLPTRSTASVKLMGTTPMWDAFELATELGVGLTTKLGVGLATKLGVGLATELGVGSEVVAVADSGSGSPDDSSGHHGVNGKIMMNAPTSAKMSPGGPVTDRTGVCARAESPFTSLV